MTVSKDELRNLIREPLGPGRVGFPMGLMQGLGSHPQSEIWPQSSDKQSNLGHLRIRLENFLIHTSRKRCQQADLSTSI
jgi:hypothetical protein